MTVESPGNQPPNDAGATRQPIRHSSRVVLWSGAAIVALIVATSVALGVMYFFQMRIRAHRLEAANRLRTLGLAAHGHHDILKQLPTNGTTDIYLVNGIQVGGPADSKRPYAGSWAYRLLPLVELKDDREHKFPFPDAAKTLILAPTYQCPMRSRPRYAQADDLEGGPFTDFVLNPYINDPEHGRLHQPGQGRAMITITDGAANTILFGHGWISTDDRANPTPGNGRRSIYQGGTNGTARNGKNLLRDAPGQDHYDDWGSPYADGCLMCMADGSVRFFAYRIDADLFFRFLHPRDGSRPDLPPIEPTDDSKFVDAFR